MNDTSAIPDEPTQPPLCTPSSSIVKLSVRARLVLGFYGVALPLICFAISAATDGFYIDQPWQSGHISMYAAMLLRPSAWLPFAPWLLVSLCCFFSWVYRPLAARYMWVRIGLYTGVVLAIQYWILVILNYSVIPLIATVLVLPSIFALSLLTASLVTRCRRFQIWHLMALTTVAACGFVAIRLSPRHVQEFLYLIPFVVLAAAPTLNLIAYIQTARHVCRIEQANLKKLGWLCASLAGWTVGWLVSWRFAVQAMLDEYSRLPVSDPNCYFANAAAYAHVWLGGGGRTLEATKAHGPACVAADDVTLAMKRLKFLELALSATAPSLQRLIRRYYDRWGEPAARYCQEHSWFANLTCVALKPVEGMAEIVRIAAGVSQVRMAAIYHQRKED